MGGFGRHAEGTAEARAEHRDRTECAQRYVDARGGMRRGNRRTTDDGRRTTARQCRNAPREPKPIDTYRQS